MTIASYVLQRPKNKNKKVYIINHPIIIIKYTVREIVVRIVTQPNGDQQKGGNHFGPVTVLLLFWATHCWATLNYCLIRIQMIDQFVVAMPCNVSLENKTLSWIHCGTLFWMQFSCIYTCCMVSLHFQIFVHSSLKDHKKTQSINFFHERMHVLEAFLNATATLKCSIKTCCFH